MVSEMIKQKIKRDVSELTTEEIQTKLRYMGREMDFLYVETAKLLARIKTAQGWEQFKLKEKFDEMDRRLQELVYKRGECIGELSKRNVKFDWINAR